jgi:hypothetical protein
VATGIVRILIMKNLASALAVLATIFALIAAFYRHRAKAAGAEPARQHDGLLGGKSARRNRFESANASGVRWLVQAGHNATAAATWAAMALIFTLASIAAVWAG